MKQLEIIEPLKEILAANSQIQSAFLYGSVARKMASANSDVDIATVITSDFDVDELIKSIETHFQNHLVRVGNVVLRNKIVLYFKSLPKVEISFATNIEEHARNYLGSEISLENIESSILFDHTGNALHYFQQITENKIAIKPEEKENLIDKFLYEFESCSNAHRRSDGYQLYFFYNIADLLALQRLEANGEWPAEGMLRPLWERLDQGALLLSISDGFDEGLPRLLERLAATRREVLSIQVISTEERDFPFRGGQLFREPETGAERRADPVAVRDEFLARFASARRVLAARLAAAGIRHVEYVLDEALDQPLQRFFAPRPAEAANA